jgi:hypothetical protein
MVELSLTSMALDEIGGGTPFLYRVHGLHVAVNLPISGLVPALASAGVDVRIELLGSAPYELPMLAEGSWQPYLRAHPGDHALSLWILPTAQGTYLRLRYADARRPAYSEYVLDPGNGHVWVRWSDTVDLSGVVPFLCGPVFGCLLRRRGALCLHGSGVAVDEHAIAFVGEAGMGKSTLAAAMAQQGHTVLSDDMVVLEADRAAFALRHGALRLRLWPEAVRMLGIALDDLPRVFGWAEKRDVDHELHRHGQCGERWQQPWPLTAIYVLGPYHGRGSGLSIAPLPAAQSLLALLPHTYPSFLPVEGERRAREFAALGRVAAAVQVRAVHRPRSIEQLPELCAVILADMQALATRASQRSS